MQMEATEAAQPRAAELCQAIALALRESEVGQMVKDGHAAFVLDFPGYISVGVGAYLQTEGIAPVLLLAACYQTGAFLDGWPILPNLAFYGESLGGYANEQGFAFVLERERLPQPEPDYSAVIAHFDNRYPLSLLMFPAFELMQQKGTEVLVDVRPAGQEVSPDLFDYYELAAEAGFSIFSSRLDLEQLSSYANAD
jgi:hypothetical protein